MNVVQGVEHWMNVVLDARHWINMLFGMWMYEGRGYL